MSYKKRIKSQADFDEEINGEFSSKLVPVNTESVDDIIRFMNNNTIGEISEEKEALDQLIFVSPKPASKSQRPPRVNVPPMGNRSSFGTQSEPIDAVAQQQPERAVENVLIVSEEFDLEGRKQQITEQFNNLIDARVNAMEQVLAEVVRNNQDTALREKLRNIYKSLTGVEANASFDNQTLQDRINKQFNTNVTWLKTRMNNYIIQYFEFAVPKMKEIIAILSKFPSAFFDDPDNYEVDILGRGEGHINLKQITFFVGYIAFLCILLFMYLITSLIKFINDVDTMFGITIETLTEYEDILELRNEYRRKACITGLGLIEYTMRCINISSILKLLCSKFGILTTIAIMGICICVFRSYSPFFNWIYVLIFKVLRVIVEITPVRDTSSYFGKQSIVVFIDSQIYGVTDTAYGLAPPSVKVAVDALNYAANTTGMLVKDTSDIVNKTMELVPLLCANITEQVVNANYTDLSVRTQDVVEIGLDNAADIVSKVIEKNIVGVSNLFIDVATSAIDTGLGAVFVGLSVIQDYSIYWGSIVIEDTEEVIETIRENVAEMDEVVKFQDINKFQNEADVWLSILLETAKAGDILLHSSISDNMGRYGNHISVISNKINTIPEVLPRNQLTINPRSLSTQLDSRVLKNIETGVQTGIQTPLRVSQTEIDLFEKFKPKGTSTYNDHIEKNDQIALRKDVLREVSEEDIARDILEKTERVGIDYHNFNSIIIPLMKDRYGEETVNKLTGNLTKVPFEPLQTPNAMAMINNAGSMVLKCIMPEEDLANLHNDIIIARRAINDIYGGSKLIIQKGILYTYDTAGKLLDTDKEEVSKILRERANAIKISTEQTVSDTLAAYNGVIKVAVVLVAGTTILYVAPAAAGLTATLLPPLYTASVTGLQLVGSVGYYSGRAVGSVGYYSVNNVFYPTLRASVYMISRLLGSIVGNTISINRDTMDVVVTNEFTKFIFGNGAMWLPLDQSIGPLIQTVSENTALVSQAALEIGDTLSPFVRHNVNALAETIRQNPNTVNAFATVTAAITSSSAVGRAINEARRNPISNTRNFRGSIRNLQEEKEILDTPQGTPRNSNTTQQYANDLQGWFNELTPEEKNLLLSEYDNRILTSGEKDAEDFIEEYRIDMIGKRNPSGKIVTEEDMEIDRLSAKLTYMKQIQEGMKKEEQAMTSAETQREPQAETPNTLIGRISGLFKGGSKKTQKKRVKKSTRKGKKKSGKKGKSNKKRRSNKKHKYSRR